MPDLLEELETALADRYAIKRELGSGGMATVYLAQDLKHDRQVALKVMHPELSAILGGERFLREIRIAAKLNHPHILALYDSGQAEGFLYYVMPYAEGESLRSRLSREKQLSVDEAITTTRRVAEALDYAHQQGVIHRDIKPENILLYRGEPMVADFGIALAVSVAGGERLTETGLSLGTPEYMSPEQATGDHTVGPASDIYSLAAVLYEMLTGEPPHSGGTVQSIIAKLLTEEPTHPRTIRSAIPEAVDVVVMKALAKLPAERFASAEQFARVLGDVGQPTGTPGSAPAPIRSEPVEREFLLSADVCRQLDRSELDPRMIGDHLHYLDNQVESHVLVCYIHSIGADQRSYQRILETSPYRGVALTLYGFEPSVRRRGSLSLNDHTIVVRRFLTHVLDLERPEITIVAGFSSGGDFGFELLANWPEERPFCVDGLLALGCNLDLDTCFVSSVIAGLSSETGSEILPDLQATGARAATLAEWLNLHEYLVNILRKFQSDLHPLRRYAQEVVRPFQAGADPFPGWYQKVSRRVKVLRCVFGEAEMEAKAVQRLLLAHLDSGVLGDRYREDSIVIEPDADHFDLMSPERVNRHLDQMVAAISQQRTS
ncbi:MAG: serine/threonine-protein kinase [Gemmatimonadota bacterium]